MWAELAQWFNHVILMLIKVDADWGLTILHLLVHPYTLGSGELITQYCVSKYENASGNFILSNGPVTY